MNLPHGTRPGTALVTGALGFVGRWLVTELQEHDREVVGADLSPEAAAFPYLPLDLTDGPTVAAAVDELRPATVFHLAAQSSAAASFADPAGTFAANLQGTLNLLEAVRALPAAERPVILAVGSCEEYGPQPGEPSPLDESTPLNPVSPYAVSKAAQTLLCRQYAASWGLHVVVCLLYTSDAADDASSV